MARQVAEVPLAEIQVGDRVWNVKKTRQGSVHKIDYHDDNWIWIWWDGDTELWSGTYHHHATNEYIGRS